MNPLSGINQAVTFLIILGVLVVAHEWGHFIIARLFKIRVDDFSIGFGKRLIRIGKLGDTEYNIRAIPLGGFVKIAGMDPDEEPINRAKDAILNKSRGDDPDSHEIPLIAENTGDHQPYDDPDGFNNKPLWQRSLVILAGPVMSFLTGFVLLCTMGWAFGLPIGKPINRVVLVEPGGEGQRIGLHAGDYITGINGVPIHNGSEMVRGIQDNLGKKITITFTHNGTTIQREASPKTYIDEDSGKPHLVYDVVDPGQLGPLGLQEGDRILALGKSDIEVGDTKDDLTPFFNRKLIANAGQPITLTVARNRVDQKDLKITVPTTIEAGLPKISAHPIGVLQFQPGSATVRMGFRTSFISGCNITRNIFVGLGGLIKAHKLHKAVGGPIKMYQMTGIAIQNGISTEVFLAAQLSISLAIFNLLPIPILDGGHLLAFFIEWVRRGKKMTPRMQQAFLLAGLGIIALLFFAISGNDVWQTIRGHVQQ